MKRNLIRLTGVTVLLIALFIALWWANPTALERSNLFDVLNRHGALGVITLGAALLIVTGGIDLSVGSVVGFAAVLFGVLMESRVHPYAAVVVVLLAGAAIGLVNGLLVTTLRLQAFLVTLCGMFVYRGLARSLTPKQTGVMQVKEMHPDYGAALDNLKQGFVGKAPDGELVFPMQFVVLLVLAAVLGMLLHRTTYGRYWYAIGYNDKAARYAGVKVERMTVSAFVICSTLAAFGGVLLLLNYGSANPSDAGNSYELYAITAAVLGGCSLRGGEGLALGFVLGALVQPLILNLMNFLEVKSSAEPFVMGTILLVGTIADELIRRRSSATKS